MKTLKLNNERITTQPHNGQRLSSREFGLSFASICGNYILGTNDLHYGYWANGLPVHFSNLKKAQDAFSEFIVSSIPRNVHSILDVGCGSGELAAKLKKAGFHVDGVSPSPALTANARKLLGKDTQIFESTFEELRTDSRYDLILFSESFQYIDVEKALSNSLQLLKQDGQILICDFFKKDVDGKSIIGGGHRLSKFQEVIAKFPFELQVDTDITNQTAPTIDVANDMFVNLAKPLWDLVGRYFKGRNPILCGIAGNIYRKKLLKIDEKYFSGQRNSEHFSKFKTYRLFLFKRR